MSGRKATKTTAKSAPAASAAATGFTPPKAGGTLLLDDEELYRRLQSGEIEVVVDYDTVKVVKGKERSVTRYISIRYRVQGSNELFDIAVRVHGAQILAYRAPRVQNEGGRKKVDLAFYPREGRCPDLFPEGTDPNDLKIYDAEIRKLQLEAVRHEIERGAINCLNGGGVKALSPGTQHLNNYCKETGEDGTPYSNGPLCRVRLVLPSQRGDTGQLMPGTSIKNALKQDPATGEFADLTMKVGGRTVRVTADNLDKYMGNRDRLGMTFVYKGPQLINSSQGYSMIITTYSVVVFPGTGRTAGDRSKEYFGTGKFAIGNIPAAQMERLRLRAADGEGDDEGDGSGEEDEEDVKPDDGGFDGDEDVDAQEDAYE